MKRTFLVTGSEGFVGRALCRALESDGHTVLRFSTSLGHDVLRAGSLLELVNAKKVVPDTVIHLAARSFVPESWKDPKSFALVNVEGTRQVISSCLEMNARLLYMSSYVYGRPRYLPIDELHQVEGFNPYAQSKILAEEVVTMSPGLEYAIVRPFNIYGPGQDPRFIIAQIIRDYFVESEVVVQSLKPKRDYLYIDDFIDGLRVLLSRPFKCEIHNFGFGTSYSVNELIESLMHAAGEKVKFRSLEVYRENEVMDVVSSCRLTVAGLWSPTVSLSDGIKRCLAGVTGEAGRSSL